MKISTYYWANIIISAVAAIGTIFAASVALYLSDKSEKKRTIDTIEIETEILIKHMANGKIYFEKIGHSCNECGDIYLIISLDNIGYTNAEVLSMEIVGICNYGEYNNYIDEKIHPHMVDGNFLKSIGVGSRENIYINTNALNDNMCLRAINAEECTYFVKVKTMYNEYKKDLPQELCASG